MEGTVTNFEEAVTIVEKVLSSLGRSPTHARSVVCNLWVVKVGGSPRLYLVKAEELEADLATLGAIEKHFETLANECDC